MNVFLWLVGGNLVSIQNLLPRPKSEAVAIGSLEVFARLWKFLQMCCLKNEDIFKFSICEWMFCFIVFDGSATKP